MGKKMQVLKKMLHLLLKKLDDYRTKAARSSLAELLTGIIALSAYVVISPALAEYQGTVLIRTFAWFGLVILSFLFVLEFSCTLQSLWRHGGKTLFHASAHFSSHIYEKARKKLFTFRRNHRWGFRLAAALTFVITGACALLLYFGCHTTTYYAAVTEVYGMPQGVAGTELSETQKDRLSGYWAIKDYTFRNLVVLTYEEPYRQLDLMKYYSSKYRMEIFQSAARIVYRYDTNRKKYEMLDQDTYIHAREYDFREPETISYYGGNNKLLMKLERKPDKKANWNGSTFQIAFYSAQDNPQLLNSTLLKMPEEETGQTSDIYTDAEISVAYNVTGQPVMRCFTSGINNLYGINGESYAYGDNRMTVCYLDKDGMPVRNRKGVMTIDLEYDGDNKIHNIRYYADAAQTEKTEGFYGVFCERFSYDTDGNLTERAQLNRDEKRWYDTNGVTLYEYAYAGNRLIQETFWGFGKTQVQDKQFQSHLISFNEHKGIMKRELSVYIDPTGTMEAGIAIGNMPDSVQTGNHKDGNFAQSPEDNENAEPSMDENTDQNIHLPKADIKAMNNLQFAKGFDTTEYSYLKLEKETVTVSKENDTPKNMENANLLSKTNEDAIVHSYESIRFVIARNNKILEKRYYDREGNLTKNENGCAVIRYKYNKQLSVINESYFNTLSEPCWNDDGFAAIETVYDTKRKDRVIRRTYLGTDNKAVFNNKLGYSYVCYEYDVTEGKNAVTERYFKQDGTPIALPEYGYASVRRLYNERGLPVLEAYYNRLDQPVCRTNYQISEILYEYADDGSCISQYYKGTAGNPANRTDTGYAAVFWEYENGLVTKERYEAYKAPSYVSAPNRTTGAAMITYLYDHYGQKLEEHYFDGNDNPVLRTDMGFAVCRYAYNDQGMLSSRSYYDTADHLTMRTDIGCAKITYEYDNRGNVSARSYFDTDNGPVLRRDHGYARIALSYNKYGQLTSELYYGVDKELIISKEYHCAGFQYTYDVKGNKTDIQYVGTDGRPMIRSDLGFARKHNEYDADGNLKVSYFDANGNPAVSKELGCASFDEEYENGLWIRSRYYDTEGNLTSRREKGYSVIELTYNENGLRTAEYYYDSNGDPVISTEYHCAGFIYEYNEDGNTKSIQYIDLDRKPIVRTDLGFAKRENIYDDQGNLTKVAYFDAEGNPAVSKELGCASYEDFYENGNWVEGRYYDTEGNLTFRKGKGYAVIKLQYDLYGQRLSESYYGTDEQPIVSTEYHCAGFSYEYDDSGNKTKIQYKGLDGKPMVRTDLGFAQIKSEFDGTGHEVKVSYQNIDGTPAVSKELGCASYEDFYENGNWVEGRYYDTEGNLTLHKEKGYAVIKSQYDLCGQRLSECYYGTDEQPIISTEYHCAGFSYEYDKDGNTKSTQYIGLDGKLMSRTDLGFAKSENAYDDQGNLIKVSYFDTEGNPAVSKELGCASYEDFYENGNWVEGRYYDTNGNPTLHKEKGYAAIRCRYDAYDRCISEFYYGTDYDPGQNSDVEHLTLRKDDGMAAVKYEYNAKGEEIRQSYYDTDMEAVISPEYHCAGMRFAYDTRGNRTDTQYIGIDGEKMVRRDLGYAEIQQEYDGMDHEIRTAYFDASGCPAISKESGFAAYESDYSNGNWTETRYYDEQGNLTPRIGEGYGYAVIQLTYDTYGQKTSETYFNAEREPTLRSDQGYAVLKLSYDEHGQCISERYYDTQNTPVISTKYFCAGFDYHYDDRGNETSALCIGTDGNAMIRNDQGYAQIINKYDDMDHKVKVSYLDTSENLILHKEYKNAGYEKDYINGNLYETRYYDEQDNLTARVGDEYDYAIIRYQYNDLNQCIEKSYYDPENNLVMPLDETYTAIRYTYDIYGQRTSLRYFDAEGNAVSSSKNHCAGFEYRYDDRGNQTDTVYIGTDGTPVMREDLGYAQVHSEYDDMDREIRASYFDAAGKPAVSIESGWASYENIYSGSNKIETRYYDPQNNLTLRTDENYASVKYQHDDYGQLTHVFYYGTDDQPVVNSKYHCAGCVYGYDERGYRTRIQYFGPDGSLMIRDDKGFAEEIREYDMSGNAVNVSRYDAEGNLL